MPKPEREEKRPMSDVSVETNRSPEFVDYMQAAKVHLDPMKQQENAKKAVW